MKGAFLICVLSVCAAECGCEMTRRPPEVLWVEPATGMTFVKVEAGRFVMGSPLEESGREAQESQHEVTLSRSFWLGAFEVTQGQWRLVMGDNPRSDRRPGGGRMIAACIWQAYTARRGRSSQLPP